MKNLILRIKYQWQYLKVSWIHEGSSFTDSAKGVVIYGDSGWIAAWLVFTFFYPKNWFGHAVGSWSEIRNLRRKTNSYYGDPRVNTTRLNGWKVAFRMILENKVNKE